MPNLLFFVRVLAVRSLFSAFVSCHEIPTALFSFFVLSPALIDLIYSVLRTFQQILSDKFLRRHLTSSIKPFCLFLTLGLLPEKNKSKWPFDTTFINSCPIDGNHATKEFDLSFVLFGGLLSVNFNQL